MTDQLEIINPDLSVVAATRKEALATGARFYIGKPCEFGHGQERFANSGHCATCHRKKRFDAFEMAEEEAKKFEAPRSKGYVSDFIRPVTLQQMMARR